MKSDQRRCPGLSWVCLIFVTCEYSICPCSCCTVCWCRNVCHPWTALILILFQPNGETQGEEEEVLEAYRDVLTSSSHFCVCLDPIAFTALEWCPLILSLFGKEGLHRLIGNLMTTHLAGDVSGVIPVPANPAILSSNFSCISSVVWNIPRRQRGFWNCCGIFLGFQGSLLVMLSWNFWLQPKVSWPHQSQWTLLLSAGFPQQDQMHCTHGCSYCSSCSCSGSCCSCPFEMSALTFLLDRHGRGWRD